jgi:hypothetical protein
MTATTSRSSQLVSYLLLVLLGLVTLLSLADFGRQLVINQQQHEDLVEVEDKLQLAIHQEEQLEERLRYGRSKAAAEAWGRELGWTRADERSVVIVEAGQFSSSDALDAPRQSSAEPSSGDGLWALLLNRP